MCVFSLFIFFGTQSKATYTQAKKKKREKKKKEKGKKKSCKDEPKPHRALVILNRKGGVTKRGIKKKKILSDRV